MKNKYLYNMQFATLTFFLINSFFINVGYNILTTKSMTDTIFDIIIGGILILLFLFLILWIRKNYKQDLIKTIMSFKILKYPLSLLLIITLGLASIYTLNSLTSFIHYYMLNEVNSFIISITIIITTFYLVKKDIPTITRISEICFYIYIIVFILGFIGLYKYIDLNNLKPFNTISINNHINTSLHFFSYSILPIFLLLGLKKEDYKKHDDILIIIFTLISIFIIFLQLILIISVLGINLTNIYVSPDIMIYKKISFLNILERVEVFLSFNQLLNGIFIITVNIYLIKKILTSFIKKEKELTILTLLGLIFIFFNNTNITKEIYLILNLIILIITVILLIKLIIHKYILQSEDLF